MHGAFADDGSSSAPSLPSGLPAGPLVFEHGPEGGGRFVLMGVLVPLLVALMVPFWLVIVQVASDSSARAILAARPLVGVQLAAGLLGVAFLFGWPLGVLACRALGRRRITIQNGSVHSEAVGRFGKSAWSEPIEAYAGLAHRVRSSLSGLRHELVLVHPRRSRTVILRSGARIPPEAAAEAARLLALAEIPSREAASVAFLGGYSERAEPNSQPAPG